MLRPLRPLPALRAGSCPSLAPALPALQVASGYLLKQDVEELMLRIGVAHTLDELLEKSDVAIESVFEDLQLKKDLFASMAESLKARAVPPDQILLCSNTMAIPMQACPPPAPPHVTTARAPCAGSALARGFAWHGRSQRENFPP